MEERILGRTVSDAGSESCDKRRVLRLACVVLWFLMVVLPSAGQAPATNSTASGSTPEPAIAAILAAFDRYEVVAMPEGHGMKDVDDFILSLIRDPTFPAKVNDIEVECGNSLYQPVLDRYIAGDDVPFTEVRKVWRNTTQSMCGRSGFFEQFFPLVRAINQNLTPAKRLRVLAGDPPIDWDHVKTREDGMKFFDREPSIVSVMEKEVLSKHRKALMLFGSFHLFHGVADSAVATYEKRYPHLTFVISDLGIYDMNRTSAPTSPFALWPNPSLALTKGSWLGALMLRDIFPPPIMIERDCKVHIDFPPDLQKPMEALVDAFLYLGPQEFRLNEPMPADIALDADYMTELKRRESLTGFPGEPMKSLKDSNQEIVKEAENPLSGAPKQPDAKDVAQSCLDRNKQGSPP
jgi:hypothetical protein